MIKHACSVMSLSRSVTCFFDCCIAQVIWDELCDMACLPLVTDFESVRSMWIKGKKYKAYNILTSAVIWSIWRLRNKFCFQGAVWSRVEVVLLGVARHLRNWALLKKMEETVQLEAWAKKLEERGARHLRQQWRHGSRPSASDIAGRTVAEQDGQALALPDQLGSSNFAVGFHVNLDNQVSGFESHVDVNLLRGMKWGRPSY
jgi:hypothetical protein